MISTPFKSIIIGVSLCGLTVVSITPKVEAQVLNLSNSAKDTILKVHNRYRADVNSPNVQWSSQLENDAQQWAAHLAKMGGRKLVHANGSSLKGQGENLWMGTAGRFSHQTMVETWVRGRQHFKSGIFPNVSKTGNWANVGHYTQVVWKNTTKIGCAQARAGGNDLLVCRYDPAGNIVGQSVF